MSRRERLQLSAAERAAIWKQWRAGDSVDKIARGLERYRSNVYYVLERAGGYTPVARQRARQQLTLAEREEISRGLHAGRSLRAIAADLGRAASTVSREIRRNRGSRYYCAISSIAVDVLDSHQRCSGQPSTHAIDPVQRWPHPRRARDLYLVVVFGQKQLTD